MTDSLPLYNSRITKTYLEFIKNRYPDLDIDYLLEYARMTKYEVEDPAHWFSQDQADRFQEALVEKTGNLDIAREAGRYTASSEGMGPGRQRILGFIKPTSVYLLMEKLYPILSRGATIKVKRLGPDKVEIVSTPEQDVDEKPYQCGNRIGIFESLAELFTNKFANVNHPLCFHKGDRACRYIIKWEKTASIIWKRIRNYSLLIGIAICLGLFFVLPLMTWGSVALLCSVISLLLTIISDQLENKELSETIRTQGDTAKDLLDEMSIRHNNALLIQKIGQATASILNTDSLLEAVVKIMEMHIDFDRGMVMLCDSDKTRLFYTAGYGYDKDKENLLRQTVFHLDNPESKGVFVVAFKNQKPFLINDIGEIEKKLSKRSLKFAKALDVQSLICAPIVYENESLGILAVDNVKSKRPLTNSDVNFLKGVASQTAVGIINASSFQKIQESEKKYRELVENANSIIMRRDINGKITFFNEFAQRFFGYSENEILGKSLEGTIFPNTETTRNHLKKLLTILTQNIDQPVITENESELRSGKKVMIAWTYRPIFDSDENFKEILCIGTDITELKRAEQEKRDLEARLQRAQKMEAIGTLAGGVAHDLNNILSGIVSYPELLLMDIPPDSPQRKPILTIQKSGERAAAIVQDLLTLARRGVVTTKVINLNAIIAEYLKSPEFENLRTHHPDVQVKSSLNPDLMNMSGSPVHLSKTVMNLVTNAAEAIPDIGEIIISTENRHVDKSLNGYDKIKPGDYVTLRVSDTGIGIPSKDLERIFEPFFTKKVMGKSGTGLGMAVVWGTVKDHKGYIDVKSVEEKGTIFTLYFPVVRKELPGNESAFSIQDIMGKGETILVVDDVEAQREIASQMLTKLGYSVVSVSSGEEAVNYMKSHATDLVVLDMIMDPGMDGLDTYKNILEIHPRQKAIITSGYSETQRVKEAQKLGATSYVKKPYLLEKIGKVIRTELDKQ
ncbi:MAG: response regulator [Deltaproteobacteria bacterium]|nr:response regulator [Deltaproteobacteria bacterium]